MEWHGWNLEAEWMAGAFRRRWSKFIESQSIDEPRNDGTVISIAARMAFDVNLVPRQSGWGKKTDPTGGSVVVHRATAMKWHWHCSFFFFCVVSFAPGEALWPQAQLPQVQGAHPGRRVWATRFEIQRSFLIGCLTVTTTPLAPPLSPAPGSTPWLQPPSCRPRSNTVSVLLIH